MAHNAQVFPLRSGEDMQAAGPACASSCTDIAAALGIGANRCCGDSGPGGSRDAHECVCRRCLREKVHITRKNRHGDRKTALARLRAAAADRAAAREAAAAERAKAMRLRSKRHRQRRRRRGAKNTQCCAACCNAAEGAAGSGEVGAAARSVENTQAAAGCAAPARTRTRVATVLKEASVRGGSTTVVDLLTTMIQDQSLWHDAESTPDPEVEQVIACHYNQLSEAAQFELLLARMQRQPVAA